METMREGHDHIFINKLIVNSMQKKKPYCIKMMYAILSAVAMLLLPVGSYAQPDGITLKVEKVPLGEVLTVMMP